MIPYTVIGPTILYFVPRRCTSFTISYRIFLALHGQRPNCEVRRSVDREAEPPRPPTDPLLPCVALAREAPPSLTRLKSMRGASSCTAPSLYATET